MDGKIPPDQRPPLTTSSKAARPGKTRLHLAKLFKNRKVKTVSANRRYTQQNKSQPGPTPIRRRRVNSIMLRTDPPSTSSALRELAVEAQLAAYPYHRSLAAIQNAALIHAPEQPDSLGNWTPSPELAQQMAEQCNLSYNGEEGFLFDEKTGLTAYIMTNKNTQENRLIFGGTTSGLTSGNLKTRSRANSKFTSKQWKANLKNAFGRGVPDSFNQAKQLTESLYKTLQSNNPSDQPVNLKLSGHSKGGAEASFAALCNDPPLEAICFSSAQLSQRVLKSIPEHHLKQAINKITHYKIKNDLIPNMGKLLRGLTHAGKVITLPAQHTYDGLMGRHDKFARHVEHYARVRVKS